MQTAKPTGATSQLSQWKEPIMWEDLKDGEKIERLREVIKQFQVSSERQFRNLRQTTEKLEKHSHNNNEVVVPIDRNFDSPESGISAKRLDGKCYF